MTPEFTPRIALLKMTYQKATLLSLNKIHALFTVISQGDIACQALANFMDILEKEYAFG